MQKTFKVPVLPYLKKYCEKKFFAGQSGPLVIEEDTLLGKQFMSLIIDARHKDMLGHKKIEMTEYITVQLSDAMAKRSPSIKKLIPISFFLDKMFKEDLITWIQSADHYGVRPFPASKDFMVHYGIDESEYSQEAAYRHYHRNKNADFKRSKILGQRNTEIGLAVS